MLEWVATGYMVAYAGLMLAGGRLADRYGWPRMLRAGLLVFTIASLACGLPALPGAPAGSAATLIAARVVQGMGAALLVPATLAVIARGDERYRMRGAAGWTSVRCRGAGGRAGVGGCLSQHAHWSWIFLSTCRSGWPALAWWRPASTHARGPAAACPVRLDLPGVAAGDVALLAFAYALSHGTGRLARHRALVSALRRRLRAWPSALERWSRPGRSTPAVRGAGRRRRHRGAGALGPGREQRVLLHRAIPAGACAATRRPGPAWRSCRSRWRSPSVARIHPRGWSGGGARLVPSPAGLALVATGIAAVALAETGSVLAGRGCAVIGFGSALTVPLGAVVLGRGATAGPGSRAACSRWPGRRPGCSASPGIGRRRRRGQWRCGPVGLLLAAALVLVGPRLRVCRLCRAPNTGSAHRTVSLAAPGRSRGRRVTS